MEDATFFRSAEASFHFSDDRAEMERKPSIAQKSVLAIRDRLARQKSRYHIGGHLRESNIQQTQSEIDHLREALQKRDTQTEQLNQLLVPILEIPLCGTSKLNRTTN